VVDRQRPGRRIDRRHDSNPSKQAIRRFLGLDQRELRARGDRMAFGRESFSPLEIEAHRGRGYDGPPEDAIFHDILRVAGMGFRARVFAGHRGLHEKRRFGEVAGAPVASQPIASS
jgi:hypothetical protein